MDIRVTYLREVLPVAKMIDIPGPPRQLLLSGPDVDRVVDVEINGVRGYSFTVSASRTISVSLPPLLTVRTVALLGREMGRLKDAVVHIGFTSNLTDVEGIQALVQQYLKCLLTTPGTDVFSKGWGGGAARVAGAIAGQEGDLTTLAAEAVSRTNRLMMSRQMGNLSIPRSERLLKATIIRSEMLPTGETYVIDIDIMNQEGQTVRAGLG